MFYFFLFDFQLQKLLFSATLSQNPEKLQQLNLFQPKLFTSVVKSNKAEKNTPKGPEAESMDVEVNAGSAQVSGKFLSLPMLMHGFLLCIAFYLSV